MKNKILIFIILISSCFIICGCTKKDEVIDTKKSFTIICTANKDIDDAVEAKAVTTYNFNNDQLVIDYTMVTYQKFNDKDTYETYKYAQSELFYRSTDQISYNLKENEEEMTLEFTMKVKDVAKNAKTEEEKQEIQASNILNKTEEAGITCEVEGIDNNSIK